MKNLFNAINMGYNTNTSQIKVIFKKKYVFVLEKLLKLNCINFYTIDNNFIIINLRYFQNKPLFYFLSKSRGGNKIYKNSDLELKNLNYSINISLFFTDKGLLTNEEAFFKKVGGEHIVDILFLSKK